MTLLLPIFLDNKDIQQNLEKYWVNKVFEYISITMIDLIFQVINLPRYTSAQKYMNNDETFLDRLDKVCRKISMKILMSKHLFKYWDSKLFEIANERGDLKSER